MEVLCFLNCLQCTWWYGKPHKWVGAEHQRLKNWDGHGGLSISFGYFKAKSRWSEERWRLCIELVKIHVWLLHEALDFISAFLCPQLSECTFHYVLLHLIFIQHLNTVLWVAICVLGKNFKSDGCVCALYEEKSWKYERWFCCYGLLSDQVPLFRPDLPSCEVPRRFLRFWLLWRHLQMLAAVNLKFEIYKAQM